MDTGNFRFRQGLTGGWKLQIEEVFAELPQVVAHAPRGRETSYSGFIFRLRVLV